MIFHMCLKWCDRGGQEPFRNFGSVPDRCEDCLIVNVGWWVKCWALCLDAPRPAARNSPVQPWHSCLDTVYWAEFAVWIESVPRTMAAFLWCVANHICSKLMVWNVIRVNAYTAQGRIWSNISSPVCCCSIYQNLLLGTIWTLESFTGDARYSNLHEIGEDEVKSKLYEEHFGFYITISNTFKCHLIIHLTYHILVQHQDNKVIICHKL